MKLFPAAFAVIAVACSATSAFADDQLVPADAKGALDGFAGRPWIKPLGFCAALYFDRGTFLKAKDLTAAKAARAKGAPFLETMVVRLQKDRSMASEDAFKAAGSEMQKGRIVTAATMSPQIEEAYKADDAKCDLILRAAQALRE
jgi:hypothetical protein